MAMQQQDTRAFVKNEKWIRLAICIKLHVKKALVGILHNTIKHKDIKGLPSDPIDLFNFMVKHMIELKNLRQDQLSLLIPKKKEVISDKLDITMLRLLIQTFSGIRNEDKNWKEPRDEDISIAAAVYRAAKIRNEIFHHPDPESIDDDEFEAKWCKIKRILADLQYKEDISGIKNGAFDPSLVENLHSNMAQDFEKILFAYKEKSKNEKMDELKTFIERKYKVEGIKSNHITTNISLLLDNYDSLMVSGEAGLGKTFSAKNLKYLWASDDILTTKTILYIDSKKVNTKMYKPSNAAPICVSDLGGMLRDKTNEYLKSFGCVTKPFKDLIVIIDGVDGLQIEEDKLNRDFLMELQEKIDKNDDISAMETIMGIYFGMFFPGSKIIVFGRKKEIDRLKDIKDRFQLSTLFNEQKRVMLKLLPFDEEDVKSLIYRATCNKTHSYSQNCTHIYSLIKDFELRTVPSHLMALIRFFECLPDPNFGRITKTKIFIITIFNLLKNHTAIDDLRDSKTFKKLVSSNKTHKILECIQNLAKMSFLSLIDDNVKIKVESYNENDVDYFKYKQMTEEDSEFTLIERDTLEQLDFFHVHDYKYYVILEPHNLTVMEFLWSCYFYSHPNEWDYILNKKLNKNRQLLIISYIAGLHSKDYFTQDFTENILNAKSSDYLIEDFLSWLYGVENIHKSLPDGGGRHNCWYGLMKNQKHSPPIFLLDCISQEVEIPQTFVPLTIVYHSDDYYDSSFEWFDMVCFKHNFLTKLSDRLDILQFIQKFPRFNFIIKGSIGIESKYDSICLYECVKNDGITFKINNLHFSGSFDLPSSIFNINSLYLSNYCHFHMKDVLLDTLLQKNPYIKCKRLLIQGSLNNQLTEKLVEIGLDVVDYIVLKNTFLTKQQIKILRDKQEYANKRMNIEVDGVEFYHMMDLPKYSKCHISLHNVDVSDYDLITFRHHVSPGYSFNLSHYRIIDRDVPFVRKKNVSLECVQSTYLHLNRVDFTQISPSIFADTISLIPSFSCDDDDHYIRPSLWLKLSQRKDCRINEMRIWCPQLKNLEHFLNIKTKVIQFICKSQESLKKLLNHIVNNQNVQFEKEIKIFLVKFDSSDWDNYEEIPLFNQDTIKNFKKEFSMNDELLDGSWVPFYEGSQNLKWWYCEISTPLKRKRFPGCLSF